MGLYDILNERKQKSELGGFNNLSFEILETLYCDEDRTDQEVADLFDVPVSKVQYKRRKWGLTLKYTSLKLFLSGRSENGKKLNDQVYRDLFESPDIDALSKVIAQFIFRQGPVESFHMKGQLSQDDMKTLNKFMVNHLAYLMKLVFEKRWIEIWLIYNHFRQMSSNWDPAESIEREEMECIKLELKSFHN